MRTPEKNTPEDMNSINAMPGHIFNSDLSAEEDKNENQQPGSSQQRRPKMKDTIVLYAGMGMGHLVPMVALAKLFLRHDLSVTILTIDPPETSISTAQAISRFASANPSISFHVLPKIPIPNEVIHNPFLRMFDIIRDGNSNLLDFLISISKTRSLRGVILDMFCIPALDVTNQLGIPTYFFFSSGASVLVAWLRVPVLHKTLFTSYKDMGRSPLDFPGLPPMPATDLPQILHDRESDFYKSRIENWPRLIEADGILINTFEELESKPVRALRAGVVAQKMPPIYCIGPLITQDLEKGGEARHECLTWLDSQPKKKVVFLCFGSMGAFLPEQIKEIATGLENSGQRFLWVVKILDDPNKLIESQSEPDLDSVLPEGFLARTKNRGMVLKSWAPQAQVLQHESIGGFVCHCGWNSVLEAITYGVPMISWPLYAEQRLNKVILVDEIKIATVMDGYDEELVRSDEVETKVRWLMESEGGKELRERMVAVKEKAAEALSEEGPSSQAFIQFLRDLKEFQKGR